MALISLASGSGAPGVSTSALALALAWPSPVMLVEADPVGYSPVTAGWFRGYPPHHRGLMQVVMDRRDGHDLTESLNSASVKVPGTHAMLVAGGRSPAQAAQLASLWDPLASALHGMRSASVDVIVDAGRVGQVGAPHPLLRASDLVLLATRTNLPALAGARGWARQLAADLGGSEDLSAEEARLGLLVIGAGRPFSTGEAASTLGLPAVATLPWDPVSADNYSQGHQSRRAKLRPRDRNRDKAATASADDEAASAERQPPPVVKGALPRAATAVANALHQRRHVITDPNVVGEGGLAR